jgi:hypothetical protein
MPGRPFTTREVLDEAVRCLAVSSRPIAERVEAARVVISASLSASDFSETEDRELLNAILTFGDLGERDERGAPKKALSDVTAEKLACDILDLRDTIMGRAIGNARTSSRHDPRARPRR